MPTNKKFLKKTDHKGYHYDHNSFQEYLLPSKTWKEEKVLVFVCVGFFFSFGTWLLKHGRDFFPCLTMQI